MRTRKPNRLKFYNYSLPGYYFVTICVNKMNDVFGKIETDNMVLNKYGKVAFNNLKLIPKIYPNVELDEFIVMPNHIHGIIIINRVVDVNLASTKKGNAKFAFPTDNRTKMFLSKIIQQYKRSSTIKIKSNGLHNFKWQRSFYDRIIRNESELYNIRKYISQNPFKWDIEHNYIENIEL